MSAPVFEWNPPREVLVQSWLAFRELQTKGLVFLNFSNRTVTAAHRHWGTSGWPSNKKALQQMLLSPYNFLVGFNSGLDIIDSEGNCLRPAELSARLARHTGRPIEESFNPAVFQAGLAQLEFDMSSEGAASKYSDAKPLKAHFAILFILAIPFTGLVSSLYINGDMGLIENPQLERLLGWVVLFVSVTALLERVMVVLTNTLYLSPAKLFARTGVLHLSTLNIATASIESIHVRQSLAGRFHDYGTVTVRGGAGTEASLRYVSSPHHFREEAMKIVAAQGRKAA